MVVVRLRYYAGARTAAGVAEEHIVLNGPGTVGTVLDEAIARHGLGLAKVLSACSFLLDGVTVRDRHMQITAGTQLDVLPPFAGG